MDYDYGASTRIEDNRMRRLASNQRLFHSVGGYLFFSTTLLGFVLPASYFWRKFSAYNKPLRILGTFAMASSIGYYSTELALHNLTDEENFGDEYRHRINMIYDLLFVKIPIYTEAFRRKDEELKALKKFR